MTDEQISFFIEQGFNEALKAFLIKSHGRFDQKAFDKFPSKFKADLCREATQGLRDKISAGILKETDLSGEYLRRNAKKFMLRQLREHLSAMIRVN